MSETDTRLTIFFFSLLFSLYTNITAFLNTGEREHIGVLVLTAIASWGKARLKESNPQKHFSCQLEALKHTSALQQRILK